MVFTGVCHSFRFTRSESRRAWAGDPRRSRRGVLAPLGCKMVVGKFERSRLRCRDGVGEGAIKGAEGRRLYIFLCLVRHR